MELTHIMDRLKPVHNQKSITDKADALSVIEKNTMGNNRICKRCLLRDLAEEDQKDLKKYLAAIKPADRASEALYEERLAVCRECELLVEATCEACGCYVEFRAYAAISRCPNKKW